MYPLIQLNPIGGMPSVLMIMPYIGFSTFCMNTDTYAVATSCMKVDNSAITKRHIAAIAIHHIDTRWERPDIIVTCGGRSVNFRIAFQRALFGAQIAVLRSSV